MIKTPFTLFVIFFILMSIANCTLHEGALMKNRTIELKINESITIFEKLSLKVTDVILTLQSLTGPTF